MDGRERWFESVPNGNDSKTVAGWFHRSFVEGLQEDADPSHWSTARDPNAGVFPITLLCLSYLTAAAGLMLGNPNPSTTEVVDFIREWFGRFPERSGGAYRQHVAVVYPLFRHGLAHQRHPGLLDTGDGRNVGWALGRETRRERHLNLEPTGFIDGTSGRRISYMLSVQADVLFSDTLHVFGAIEKAAASDDVLAGRIREGAESARRRSPERLPKKLLREIQALLDAFDAANPRVP